MRLQSLFALALLAAICGGGRVQAEGNAFDAGLNDWAVGILAADWRDGSGAPIEAFENARFALTEGFAAAGFNPENITDLSLRPNALDGTATVAEEAFAAFEAQAKSAQAGCLLYFTSHGSPSGMVLGDEGLLSPKRLDGLVDQWCGERPTVVIVSACFSGVFIPALAAPNRMVMTAARPDRSSFGCGADAQYPYFDGCVLESLPAAADFIHLSSLTRKCVARREREENLRPASEPQTRVGTELESAFIFLNIKRPEPAAQGDISPPPMP